MSANDNLAAALQGIREGTMDVLAPYLQSEWKRRASKEEFERETFIDSQSLPPEVKEAFPSVGAKFDKRLLPLFMPTTVYNEKTGQTQVVSPLRGKYVTQKQRVIRGAEPVIESNLATRERVNEMLKGLGKETLSPEEDIARYEFDKLSVEYNSKITANAPKQIPSEQIDKVTNMRSAIDGLSDIKGQFFNMLKEGDRPADPIMGRWNSLKESLGIMTDEQQTKFQTDLIAQMNTYLNTISGAAITEQEAKRLMRRIPKVASTSEQFTAQWESFDDELRRSLSNRIETLRDANFKVGNLDKYILKKKSYTPAVDVNTPSITVPKDLQPKATEQTLKPEQEARINYLKERKRLLLEKQQGQ